MDIGKDLTKRQQEIFDFIKKYSAGHGYPPTVRDIGKAVGLASSSTVHAHLANLEKLGLVRRDPTKPRAIELLDRAWTRRRTWSAATGGLPLSAGSRPACRSRPRRTSRTTSTCRPIPGGDEGEFILAVQGDSMVDAGIFDGDYVVVRPQDTAVDGEIIVALVEEEATVKRFFRETDHIRLQPENKTMEPIRARDVSILGRVVGVFRKVVLNVMALLIDHDRPRALERAPRLFPDSVPAPQAPAPRAAEPATAAEPHGATLDDLLTGTWDRPRRRRRHDLPRLHGRARAALVRRLRHRRRPLHRLRQRAELSGRGAARPTRAGPDARRARLG